MPLDVLAGPIYGLAIDTNLIFDPKPTSLLDIVLAIEVTSVLMSPLGKSLCLGMLSSMKHFFHIQKINLLNLHQKIVLLLFHLN